MVITKKQKKRHRFRNVKIEPFHMMKWILLNQQDWIPEKDRRINNLKIKRKSFA